MDLQDPKVQRILLAGLASAVVLYVFFGTTMASFTFPSQRSEIAQLNEEYERLSRELERARLTVKNMAKLEREFEYLHRQWNVARSLLPEDNEMSGLLRQVTAAGTQAGLEFVRFEPRASLAQGFYMENPVYVEVEGTYHQVGTFLGSLANINRIINVRNLNIDGVRPEDQADESLTHTLAANMEILSYSVNPNGEAVGEVGQGPQTLAANSPMLDHKPSVSGARDKITGAREAAVAQGSH